MKASSGSAIIGGGTAAAPFGAGAGNADTDNADAIEAQTRCDLTSSTGSALGYGAKQDTGMPGPEYRGDVATA